MLAFIDTLPPLRQRHPVRVVVDVVRALFLRELVTRFGQHRLGAVWLVAEPALIVLLFVAMFGLRHPVTNGIDTATFILTGFVPWMLFRNSMTQVANAADANAGLFAYRQVRPISAMVARVLLELALSMVIYLCLLACFAWWGLPVSLPRPLELSAAFIAMAILGGGLGMVICAIGTWSTALANSINLAVRPLMWMSGVMFSIEAMPAEFRSVLVWNPVLHGIELVRAQQFGPPAGAYAEPLYLALWLVGILTIGLAAYRATWRRMVGV